MSDRGEEQVRPEDAVTADGTGPDGAQAPPIAADGPGPADAAPDGQVEGADTDDADASAVLLPPPAAVQPAGEASGAEPPPPAANDGAESSVPKKRRAEMFIVLFLAAMVVVAAAGYVWVQSPNEARAFSDPLRVSDKDNNTMVYAALVSLGIDDPFVHVTPAVAFVAFDVDRSPANASWLAQELNITVDQVEAANATVSPDDLMRFILGAVAETVPGVADATVERHDRSGDVVVWRVALSDVLDFFGGVLSLEQLEAAIQRT